MIQNILKSWKTSIIGGGFLTKAILIFVETGDWKQTITPALLGLLGLFCKDANVSGSGK